MMFGSVCSGIEAASVAWNPLGWEAVAFSEIEPFPCAVLAHHYPSVPNWGDMTKFQEWPDADVDLLCGGTPCQSFSVAGLRKGLADPRGNLMLTFGAIAAKYRPRWLVWENVPGVLSSNGGRDFGAFLGMLGQLGYGFAYRVLDAQYFGVPQRRRRVFVVGCLGDWRRAAAVLFERHSMSGDSAPRREAREKPAGSVVARAGRNGGASNADVDAGHLLAFGGNNTAGPIDVATARNACASASASGRMDFELETFLVQPAHTLRGEGFDASEDGTGRGTPLVPVAFSCKDYGADAGEAQDYRNGTTEQERSGKGWVGETPFAVRRLTVEECEFLQGFPRGYSKIPWRNKPANECPDGPRYKALGNSWAVPVVRWIGERIQEAA